MFIVMPNWHINQKTSFFFGWYNNNFYLFRPLPFHHSTFYFFKNSVKFQTMKKKIKKDVWKGKKNVFKKCTILWPLNFCIHEKRTIFQTISLLCCRRRFEEVKNLYLMLWWSTLYFWDNPLFHLPAYIAYSFFIATYFLIRKLIKFKMRC